MAYITTYICKTCDGDPEFEGIREIEKHMKEIHPDEGMIGSRKGIEFLDGAKGWFRNTFEVKIGDVDLIQVDVAVE